MRTHSLLSSLAGPLFGLGYGLLLLMLWPTEQPYWMLPYGLRFGALLLCPWRYWGWLLGCELLAAGLIDYVSRIPMGWRGYLLGSVPEPLLVAGCLWLLRRTHLRPSLRDPGDVSKLLLSAALIVAITTAWDAGTIAVIHRNGTSELLLQVLGQDLLGNYVSILLLVPLLVMLFRAPPSRNALASLTLDGLLVMLPTLAILLVLSEHAAPQPQFARILSLAPVLFFAFRHGWRGAGLSMMTASVGMSVIDRFGNQMQMPPTAATYLFLAVTGTGALMLGAATDALRRSSDRVAEQNVYLAAVNRRLDRLARQLRDAARGNLQSEENQRRHMAAELHDELGQNLTAIQTHVKLAQSRLQQAGMEDIGASINLILGHMRRALHRVLDDLRPAVLDEFGLLRALDEGPIRDLLRTAGIVYRTELHGDPRLLDESTRTAIYRLVQESATNTVKHAQATEFLLRLRIGERQGGVLAMLDIRDNGTGLPSRIPRGGRGLQGMRDRVTSLGGLFRLRPSLEGFHLRILLRGNMPGSDALEL